MSVAFSPNRNVVPASNSAEISDDSDQLDTRDSRSASCAWSFCSGQDDELSSSPDEAFKLINLRNVSIKYGSQAIDSDSDTEEGTQSCDISDNVREKALSVQYIMMGLVATAGVLTVGAVTCRGLTKESAEPDLCPSLVAMTLPFVAASLALSAIGVKKLVEAYKERNNT